MITCQHARQLFDRYLDGELSPSLQAELHAHQLSCSACQTELAMLEACGDVIMLDRRREPTLSASFTDRVLMARRAQFVKQPRRRNWSRTLVMTASPLAAAASIVLVLTLMWPSASQRPNTKVLSDRARVSETTEKTLNLIAGGSNVASTGQAQERPASETAASSFMDPLLSSVVEGTTQAVEKTKNGLSHLGVLWQQALTTANAQLAAQEDSPSHKSSQSDRIDSNLQDLPGPVAPDSDSDSEAGSDLLLDPL